MAVDTNREQLLEAIQVFKDRYGIYEPLDNDRLNEIILELKQQNRKKPKRRKR